MSSETLTNDNASTTEVLRVESEGTSQEKDLPTATSTSLSTPPSSAFQKADEAMASGGKMLPPPKPESTSNKPVTRKRSRDESNADPEVVDSSQTVVNDPSGLAAASKQFDPIADSSATVMADTQNNSAPKKTSRQATSTHSQQAPRSGQGSQRPKTQDIKQEQASQLAESAPQPQADESEDDGDDDDENDAEEDEDEESENGSESSNTSDRELPEVPLRYYDWEELEARYHAKMSEAGEEESAIMSEFNHMVNYFGLWAEVGSGKEVDRSFKRLKTQMTYVENEEYQLEQKRQHYTRVVDAFKTVGVLLSKRDWANDIVPNRRRMLAMRESQSTDNEIAPRPSRSGPTIQLENWAARVVDDIDMKAYHYPDTHVSRCVIL